MYGPRFCQDRDLANNTCIHYTVLDISDTCVTTQEPTRPVKFMDRPKNSQSDCRVTACRMIGNLNTIQNSACGHSAPAARDCMQNSRESQY